MRDGKLINLLHRFSPKELKSFDKYVRSPFFNEDERLVQLFEMVDPTVNGKQIPSKKEVWQRIQPDKPYRDAEMRRLSSGVVKLAENFLAYHTRSRYPIHQQNSLLRGLNQRELAPYFEQALKGAINAQDVHPFRDSSFYYNQYLIESEYNTYLEKAIGRFNDTNLEKEANNLDLFYLSSKLKLCCLFLNLQNVLSIDYKLLLMDEILIHLEKNRYPHIPVISIYYHILKTLKDPEQEKNYYELKELLQRHAHLFPAEEARIMYIFAQNYCIKQINLGKSNFLREIFELYQTTLKKELLFEKGHLTPFSYKNIAVTGLRLKEYQWVENFIHNYKNKISKQYRKNAYTYCMALLHFSRKSFDEALVHLQQVRYNDIFFNLDSRSLLLRTYYELEEIESLYSMMDSFRIFLRRNKLISDQHRTNYLNLIRFIRKATKIIPGEVEKVQKLKAEVKMVGQVSSVAWLQEKLDQLEHSR